MAPLSSQRHTLLSQIKWPSPVAYPRQATNFLVVPRKTCGPANGVSSPDPFTPFAVCAGAATSGPCVSTSGEPLFIQDNAGDIALVRANLPESSHSRVRVDNRDMPDCLGLAPTHASEAN